MSKTVRYKLSEAEFRIVQEAAEGLGITVDKLGRQSLFYVLAKAQELGEHLTVQRETVQQAVHERSEQYLSSGIQSGKTTAAANKTEGSSNDVEPTK